MCSVRAALPPFVNEFEAWMPPETRCVRALCPERGAMARVWLGQEGGRGRAGAATTRVRFVRMTNEREKLAGLMLTAVRTAPWPAPIFIP